MKKKYDKLQHDLNIPTSPGDKAVEEVNDNPIEEIRLTVPITDDPTMLALTIRTWVLGLMSCVILSFVNRFFSMSVSIVCDVGRGQVYGAMLPEMTVTVPVFGWTFSLNPGPFNIKEHVLYNAVCKRGE
ncbi:hypothetical protein V2J09_020662 [Rumex salicifolius]